MAGGGQPNNKNAEKWTEEKAVALGEDLIEWLLEKDENGNDKQNIFYKEFLVMEKNLYAGVIDYLTDKFESFSNLIKRANEIQELKLNKLGVQNKLNPTMTIFCLKNHHHYKDRTQVDNTSSDGSMSPERVDLSKLSEKERIAYGKLKLKSKGISDND